MLIVVEDIILLVGSDESHVYVVDLCHITIVVSDDL